jgi:geranylgeranyl pyrophosphate synthase
VDDLLDFTASAQTLGKPVLSDLKEGKVTLPLIYAMENGAIENGHREARELVARVLEEKEFNTVRPETIVSLVQDSGALDRTRSLAHEYARRAKACLHGHVFANGAAANGGAHASEVKFGCGADSEYARALATLPDFVLEREN